MNRISPALGRRKTFILVAALATSCAGLTAATAQAAVNEAVTPSACSAPEQVVGSTLLVSVRESCLRTAGPSYAFGLSADGHSVLFTSTDSHLLAGEAVLSRFAQLYLRDLRTGDIELVSRATDGGPANGKITSADLSDDASRVVFATTATNMDPGDTNERSDVYLFGAAAGVRLVSHDSSGGPGNAVSGEVTISGDGLRVAYTSQSTNLDSSGHYWPSPTFNIFRYDVAQDASTLITESYRQGLASDADSHNPDISRDGSRIAFDSLSHLLVPRATFDSQIFVYDSRADVIALVSGYPSEPGPGHDHSPSISAEGNYIVYSSQYSPNANDPLTPRYINLFLIDLAAGVTTLVTRGYDGSASTGGQPTYSGTSDASISSDGSRLAFTSSASNLVPGDSNHAIDAFGYDRRTGRISLLTADRKGGPANGASGSNAVVSADGSAVLYDSKATDLVRRDKNGASDVFLFRAS